MAGLGCRRGCALSQLRDLLLHTLALYELPLSALAGLASSQPWDTIAPRLLNFPEPSRFRF